MNTSTKSLFVSPTITSLFRTGNVFQVRTMCVAILLCGILSAGAKDLRAGSRHNERYRHLDDLAFSAFVEARELRWEIHDDFVESRDYDHLLEDADRIVKGVHRVQAAILAEESDKDIREETLRLRNKIDVLKEHLGACDYAVHRPGRRQPTAAGKGYHFTPETKHVGAVHVRKALEHLDRVEATVAHLQDDLVKRRRVGSQGDRDIRSVPPLMVPQGFAPSTSSSRDQRSEALAQWLFRVGF
ncbi:hypothetical protein KOR42_20020 [Thalassoglobus neptunius]|uniref:Uncharacterized protein n=1 Tax=Thalassoglobus neptunius TaxID=1938619 RepID=A0A5C5X6R7_9PLAN|nr:hypothetical protein [Thalassoglobus neptunius]TWT58620.1 hypothetical protein KOR42_20020 [Thalassoglobus neptunius]